MLRFFSICIILFTFIIVSCSSTSESHIEEDTFISIYARLLIINQLFINNEYHDKLVEELLQEYKVKIQDIQSTVEFYQNSPERWAQVLDKVNEKLTELQKDKNRGVKIQ